MDSQPYTDTSPEGLRKGTSDDTQVIHGCMKDQNGTIYEHGRLIGLINEEDNW